MNQNYKKCFLVVQGNLNFKTSEFAEVKKCIPIFSSIFILRISIRMHLSEKKGGRGRCLLIEFMFLYHKDKSSRQFQVWDSVAADHSCAQTRQFRELSAPVGRFPANDSLVLVYIVVSIILSDH